MDAVIRLCQQLVDLPDQVAPDQASILPGHRYGIVQHLLSLAHNGNLARAKLIVDRLYDRGIFRPADFQPWITYEFMTGPQTWAKKYRLALFKHMMGDSLHNPETVAAMIAPDYDHEMSYIEHANFIQLILTATREPVYWDQNKYSTENDRLSIIDVVNNARHPKADLSQVARWILLVRIYAFNADQTLLAYLETKPDIIWPGAAENHITLALAPDEIDFLMQNPKLLRVMGPEWTSQMLSVPLTPCIDVERAVFISMKWHVIPQYQTNKKVQAIMARDSIASPAIIFAMTQMIADGYLVITIGPLGIYRRLWRMLLQLPADLQMVLCNRLYDQPMTWIPSRYLVEAWRILLLSESLRGEN